MAKRTSSGRFINAVRDRGSGLGDHMSALYTLASCDKKVLHMPIDGCNGEHGLVRARWPWGVCILGAEARQRQGSGIIYGLNYFCSVCWIPATQRHAN